MQILHPFAGSIQLYLKAISDPDLYRPDHCPQCEAKQPLTGHGFYSRTLVDPAFDGMIRVRRYLCRLCQRTVSLLPDFALPWLRFSLTVISLFLVAPCSEAAPRGCRAGEPNRPPCRISAASSDPPLLQTSSCARCGSGALASSPPARTSSPVLSPCSKPSAGSPPTASCSRRCALTCWAGLILWLRKERRAGLVPVGPLA
jgi:hypothetical protein